MPTAPGGEGSDAGLSSGHKLPAVGGHMYQRANADPEKHLALRCADPTPPSVQTGQCGNSGAVAGDTPQACECLGRWQCPQELRCCPRDWARAHWPATWGAGPEQHQHLHGDNANALVVAAGHLQPLERGEAEHGRGQRRAHGERSGDGGKAGAEGRTRGRC